MNKIDLGFLNPKQFALLIKEVEQSYVDIIMMHIIRTKDLSKIALFSVILEFRNQDEKILFDKYSGELVKKLKKGKL